MIGRAGHWLRRALHHPVVHFTAVGAILFTLRNGWQPAEETTTATRQQIVVTAERVGHLRSDFQQRWGAPPTPSQLRALINHAVEDEMLYREARILALGFKDGSVRRRLVEKARVVSSHPARSQEELYRSALALGLDDDVIIRRLLAEKMRLLLQHDPQDGPIPESAMQDYLERNHKRFVQPETVTLTHVFFSKSARRDHMTVDATAALARIGTQAPSSTVVESGDPFPLGQRLRGYSRQQLISRFGQTFADAVFALEPRTWSDPLATAYGLHLVWVDEHQPERLPTLSAVREPIALELSKQRAAENLQRGLQRLRNLYEIRIEAAPVDVVAAGTMRTTEPAL